MHALSIWTGFSIIIGNNNCFQCLLFWLALTAKNITRFFGICANLRAVGDSIPSRGGSLGSIEPPSET